MDLGLVVSMPFFSSMLSRMSSSKSSSSPAPPEPAPAELRLFPNVGYCYFDLPRMPKPEYSLLEPWLPLAASLKRSALLLR